MKKLVVAALFACVCSGCGGLASANTAAAPVKDSSVVDTLKQLEQDLGDAMVAEGLGTGKTAAVGWFGWISSRSAGTGGWWFDQRVPG